MNQFTNFKKNFLASGVIMGACVGGLLSLGSQSVFAAPPSLKMGVFLSMSGGTATFGQETYNGMKMAIDELNAKKDINIKAVLEDEKSEPADAANAVRKLVNVDKVDVVLGSVASSNTSAAAPIAQAAKVPLLSPASTNVKVTEVGDYISRICFVDDFQGFAMAKFAVEDLKTKTAAIVTDSSSDYSQGLAASFKDTFQKLGGKVVVEVSYSQKDQDFSSQLTKIRTKKPDIIFVPGYYTEVGNMIRQAKNLKITSKFMGGDGWSSPKLFELAGDAIVGNYFAAHFSDQDPDPKVQNFVKGYQKKFGAVPSDMSALGYDSVFVVADAVKRSGNKVDKEALKNAINATKGFVGVTGTISLDAKRNATKPLVILQTQKDRATFFKRVNP